MRRPVRDNEESFRRISRRSLIMGGAMAATVGALGWRMRQLSVDQANEFRLLAEENRINIRLIPPARGRIFDREGRTVAENVPSYRITVVREEMGDVTKVIERLAQLVELDPDELDRAIRDIERLRGDTPVTVAERVTWEEISRVAVNPPHFRASRQRSACRAITPCATPMPIWWATSAPSVTVIWKRST
ncbi:MAG: hypothetical protein AAF376_20580, partial [Pseudomonadota bacterium]